MFHTVICDMLNIRYPILMGAMQGAGKPRLVAAVSEGGGLGVLPTFGETEADLLRQIEETRKLTGKPFGVNITPVGRAFTEKRAQICIDEKIPVVTTGLGDPGPDAVGAMRAVGIKVIPVVPTVRHALRVEAEGADAIVASGTEGGGHVGWIATLPLVPQVVDAVNVPVIAAGGIGDARGFLAALSLGAVGAQLGTRLICTTEAEDPGWYKEAILRTGEEGTIISKALTGKTTRAFATPEVLAYEEARLRGATVEELKQHQRAVRAGRKKGEEYEGSRQAVVGQICGMLKSEAQVKPAAAVIEEIITEAAAMAKRMGALVSAGA